MKSKKTFNYTYPLLIAPRYMIWLARIFGKKTIAWDDGVKVVGYWLFGRLYIVEKGKEDE